jgi:colicin import membrane protein
MSTIFERKRTVTPPPPDNPWYYGWRDVHKTLPDGTTKHEQIPLTLEDALHPHEGDYIVESDLHDLLRAYLSSVFRYCVAHDPQALVLSDVGVYWDHPELDHHAPDVCVIFGVKEKKPVRPSFQVRDEGVRPYAIVEIVSPNTRENDVETKFVEYHMAKVPFYFIFDKEREEDPWTLQGYRWTPVEYSPLNADQNGRLWLDGLGIWLAAEGQNIVCYDGAGERIGDYTQNLERMKKAEADLGQAVAREEAEKERTEAEKQRAETEKQRAETEKQRAEAERQRAEAEKQARQVAEAKLKETEAELGRLRGK